MTTQTRQERERTKRRREARAGKKAPPAAAPRGRSGARSLILPGLIAVVGVGSFLFFGRQTGPAGYQLVAVHPHDARAYTQGLLYSGGRLYESTGRQGQSSVRLVELESGRVLQKTELPPTLFGEGLALHGGRLYQLTWHAGECRVYDPRTLQLLERKQYEGEGWGLTSDGESLIRSDGSEVLRFLDPDTLAERRSVRVMHEGRPLRKLNELEWVDGEILANVWQSDSIARIDPESGEVERMIDLTGLYDYSGIPDPDAVPNGIAYDPEGGRLFVTGKLWPHVFQIAIRE